MPYKTGFCGTGCCEGTAPVSFTGKPMKVCTAFEICTCTCHAKFNRMYEMAGAERQVHQNPNYVPVIHPSFAEYFSVSPELDGESLGVTTTTRTIDQPSEIVPSVKVSVREFTQTSSGYRQRGQLELEVQQVCIKSMNGEFSERLTPQFIAEQINPESPPSTGAIGAVFNRWEAIGYAKIHRKPLYFAHLTVEGMRDGLEACKRRNKR
ncbi:hypothetical protein GMA7_57 [Gordonia phage GMA7]|uniref:Uncharacterized protein n=1 Tax=Gordonia phage GMA7 TaxID=1647286 RepID=A0A0K0N6D7_9CAUD|nr:hypothetical protein AU104_gp061 [Gordonia phage GMA7]AKJ72494.1 hypothetical protein GMA7_57 [Gordonia phage GMA7]